LKEKQKPSTINKKTKEFMIIKPALQKILRRFLHTEEEISQPGKCKQG
jgi:hypothetical protein